MKKKAMSKILVNVVTEVVLLVVVKEQNFVEHTTETSRKESKPNNVNKSNTNPGIVVKEINQDLIPLDINMPTDE